MIEPRILKVNRLKHSAMTNPFGFQRITLLEENNSEGHGSP